MTAARPKKKNRTSTRPHTLQMCISHQSAGMRPGPWEPSGPLCLHGTAASRASSPLTRVLSDPLLLFCRLRDESGREAGSSRSCRVLSCLCQGQLADVTAAPSLGDPLPPPRWVCSPRGGGLTPLCFLGRGFSTATAQVLSILWPTWLWDSQGSHPLPWCFILRSA